MVSIPQRQEDRIHPRPPSPHPTPCPNSSRAPRVTTPPGEAALHERMPRQVLSPLRQVLLTPRQALYKWLGAPLHAKHTA